MGTAILIGIALVPVVLAVQLLWNRWRTGRFFCIPVPRPYRDRPSQQAAWDDRYQHMPPPEVDRVISLICDTFLFHPDNRCKLAPADRLMDIYRACYPRRWGWLRGDCMEIENIMMTLKIEPADVTPDISLGDLVDLAIRRGNAGEDRDGADASR